ncbi:MAG: DNA polymerase Y family protein [Rubrivivax sp.]|nr:DNA polymerase Y family protein [Rubrivivax sp.]
MLWLALHLPRLSLEAFCATLPAQAHACPVALIAEHRVHSVNTAAAERGLEPGLKRSTALALAADLLLAESDAARDAAALQAVAHAALAFTPAVTLQDTQTVLLEVQASLRLFGGLAALRQRLAAALAPLGHQVQVAAAPSALGAALLAQWHPAGRGDLVLGAHATRLSALQALLAAAPLGLLNSSREHGQALQGMGLHTLSDLSRLPRAGLARRFGEELLDELDRALGLQADSRRWLELPAVFESRLELFARADSTEQVLYGAAVLLARLVAWAQARHARVGAFTLRMRHEPRRHQTTAEATELRVELAEPAGDAAHLQTLLRERLARVELAAPTLELQLHCSQLVAGHAPNGELFPTRASQAEGLTRLLERLRARLGDAQVQRLEAVADHRPERASRAVPAQGGTAASAALAATAMATELRVERVEPALPLHRPVWLWPEPLPLAEREALPLLDGRPLQLVSGPERIEAGWWDDTPVARDYFIAQAADGSLVWVYRGRLPGERGEVNWFLQGRFA